MVVEPTILKILELLKLRKVKTPKHGTTKLGDTGGQNYILGERGITLLKLRHKFWEREN